MESLVHLQFEREKEKNYLNENELLHSHTPKDFGELEEDCSAPH